MSSDNKNHDMKKEDELLLKEYELLTSQYQHEDRLLESRNQFFIILNVGILGVIKILSQNTGDATHRTTTHPQIDVWIIFMCIFGFISCVAWFLVGRAGKYYILFRMKQAEAIGKRVGGEKMIMFSQEDKIRCNKEYVDIDGERMSPPPKLSLLGDTVSNFVALAFAVLWIFILFFI